MACLEDRTRLDVLKEVVAEAEATEEESTLAAAAATTLAALAVGEIKLDAQMLVSELADLEVDVASARVETKRAQRLAM